MRPAIFLKWICLLVLCLVAFPPGGAQAALPAAPPPTVPGTARSRTPKITLKLDEQLALQAKIDRDSYEKCRVYDGNWRYSSAEISVSQAGTIGPTNMAERTREGMFFRAVLDHVQVRCQRRNAKEIWDPVQVEEQISYTGGTKVVSSQLPAFSPEYGWELAASTWGKRVLQTLGTPTTCRAKRKATTGSSSDSDVVCSLDTSSGSFSGFVLGAEMTSGVIELDLELDSRKLLLKLNIAACKFDLSGAVPVLVRGAKRQRIVLSPMTNNGTCVGPLREVEELRIGSEKILLSQTDPMAFENGIEFEGHSIPETLPLGTRDAEVRGPRGLLGTAHVEVVEALSASKLFVQYDLSQLVDANGHFLDASGEATKGFAVLSPERRDPPLVGNSTTVAVPAPLPRSPQVFVPLAKAPEPPGSGTEPMDTERVDSIVLWLVDTRTLEDGVRFTGSTPLVEKDEGGQRVLPAGPESLLFEVTKPSARPLLARLSLVRLTHEKRTKWTEEKIEETISAPDADAGADGGNKAGAVEDYPGGPGAGVRLVSETSEAWTREVLLETSVKIAEGARRESVPLPIRDLLKVRCGAADEAGVLVNETRAIDDEAVRLGRCKLILEPAKGKERVTRALYGPQVVIVSVQRDGAEKAQSTWEFSPGDPDAALVLPVPIGDDKGNGIYTVEARLAARPSGEVVYRGATKDRVLDQADTVEHSQLRFVARLRPRGLFGWPCKRAREKEGGPSELCVRTYVTATTQIGGIRFPAELRELRSSSEATGYQFVSPRLGILAAIEPWDYDAGVNKWPMNPAFQIGGHFLNLADGAVEMTSLVGVAGTFPLVSDVSSQLGAKLTAGLFWEHNFQGGDHLLVSVSLNIGSLLSGTQK